MNLLVLVFEISFINCLYSNLYGKGKKKKVRKGLGPANFQVFSFRIKSNQPVAMSVDVQQDILFQNFLCLMFEYGDIARQWCTYVWV